MADDIDWSLTTFDGLRRHQRREFRALPLREKIRCIEELSELADHFALKRAGRTGPRVSDQPPQPPRGRPA